MTFSAPALASEPIEETELDAERDELLLRPVVQVPLDLPPLRVLRLDEPTS